MASRRAFTLLELTLVMAIILITLALASPLVFDALYGDTRVTASADMVRASWAQCRGQAIEEGRSYVFCIIPNSGKFKICPHETIDQGVVDPTVLGTQSSNPTGLEIEDELATGVRFGTADAPLDLNSDGTTEGEYVPIAIFLADGSAQEDVEISLGATGASLIRLKLRALTGTGVIVRQE